MIDIGKGYALDFASPIRHVANEMEAARSEGRAVTIDEMANRYHHPIAGDLVRVQKHHGLANDTEAIHFLIEQAVVALGNAVEEVDDGYRLSRPMEGMRYPKESGAKGAIKSYPPNPYEGLSFGPDENGTWFNKQSGRLSDNIRSPISRGRDNMDELRESMRTFGWIEQLPAWVDERGVVIVGHRRLAVAKEQGIPPVKQLLRDEEFSLDANGEAKKFALAYASNVGGKSFTPEDRKSLARYLYKFKAYTQAQVATALGVSQSQVSSDLSGTDKSTRRGRPRKVSPEMKAEIINLHDQKVPQDEIADRVGTSRMPVRSVIEHEEGRREVKEEQAILDICPCCGRAR